MINGLPTKQWVSATVSSQKKSEVEQRLQEHTNTVQNKQMAGPSRSVASLSKATHLPSLPSLPKTLTKDAPFSSPTTKNEGIGKLISQSTRRLSSSLSSKVAANSISKSNPTTCVAGNGKNQTKFNAAELKKGIGQYNYEKKLPNDQKVAVTQGQIHAEVSSFLEGSKLDKAGKIGNGLEILNRGTDNPSSTAAREKFIDHLEKRMGMYPQHALDPRIPKEAHTVSMNKLLGAEGVKLYHKAVKEERNSTAFREAVFHKSATKYDGPAWTQRMVLWIGGPSASGKSFAATSLVKEIGEKQMKNAGGDKGNVVVSVDGGIERELSQMRQLVLQVSLSKGHSGISDLHENTHLGIKSLVQKASISNSKLSLVVPNTFSNPFTQRKIQGFAKLDNTKQVFSEILGAGDFESLKAKPQGEEAKKINKMKQDTFQKTVETQGNNRAWKDNAKKFDGDIIMNTSLPCESKNYNAKYFSNGVEGSKKARKAAIEQGVTFVGYKNELEIIGNLYITTSQIEGFLQKQPLDVQKKCSDQAGFTEWVSNPDNRAKVDGFLKTPEGEKLAKPEFHTI